MNFGQMNMNQGMNNMNQIIIQISQLMFQSMNNINQIMTNMNQLMTNMNQMNKLINDMNIFQSKFEMNNHINLINNNLNKLYDPNKTLFVLFDFKGQKFTVNCQADEKLNDVIKRYREKSNDLRSDIFIFNSKRLNLNRTIEEEGISKGSLIIVPAQNLSGGGEYDIFQNN